MPVDTAQRPRVSLWRIARLFAPYWGRLTALLVLIVTSSLVALVPPFLLREILDVALPLGRTQLLSALAAGMLAVVIMSSATGMLQSYLSLTVSLHVLNDLRAAVYGHLQRMSLAFFTRTRTGDMQSRITNDIGGVGGAATNVAVTIAGSVTTLVGSLLAMLALDWRLTIASVLMVPVFVWITRRVGEERRETVRALQCQLAAMTTMVEETLSVQGFLLGRVLGRSDALRERFARQSGSVMDLSVRATMTGRWRQAVIQMIMAGMPVVIYWVAGLTANHGTPVISIGTLVAFTTLQQGLFGPTTQLLQAGIVLQSALALFERIFEYLDLPVDMAEPQRPRSLECAKGHVRLEHVDFHYGDVEVLRNIDIDVPAGHSLAIVGATGAGKTTLGQLVPRLHDVTAGRVTIDGVDVRDLSFATLAATVGVVSQDTYLFHASVADNLRFAKPDASDEELRAAARSAHIHDLIAGLPDGYDTLVGERGYRFSGGERQRLAIARTMLRDPVVLVLDEATSALDTRTERAVQQALDRLADGRTTITIAHRLSTIRDADRIVVLDNGRIVEQGTHEDLLALSGHYSALTESQPISTPGG